MSSLTPACKPYGNPFFDCVVTWLTRTSELAFTKFGDRILSDRVIVAELYSGVKDVIDAERRLWYKHLIALAFALTLTPLA